MTPSGLVFPVGPRLRAPFAEYDAPEISQSFLAPSHLGVDIMFRRDQGETREESPGNAAWCMPRNTPVLALAAGVVVYAKRHTNGYRVRLTHGPVDTLYLHLAAPPLVLPGQNVVPGQMLGVVGADPTDPEGLPHLHFEIRVGTLGTLQAPIDPVVLLGDWIGA